MISLTKNKKHFIIATAILLILYNIIVFVIPFTRNVGFWIGYSFTMFALFLATGIILLAFGNKQLKSKFFGLPLVFMVLIYLLIQFIAGIIEMAVTTIPFQYSLVFNILILAVCLIGLIGTNIANEEIAIVEDRVEEKVLYIRSLQMEVENLAFKSSDVSTKKDLKELAESIRYSDPMSSPQLAEIEKRIKLKVSELGKCISDSYNVNLLCNELQQLLAERNSKCIILK